MAVSQLQNFYKEQIAVATGAGAGNIYVSTKPTPTNGFLVISPGSESLREIIKYTGTGTDGTGDYVTVALVADRGLGGTTAQAHEVGEPIRMNYTAEHQKEIDDTIEAIVAGGTPDASTTVKGRSKLSVAPVDAADPIAVGDNDPRMNATDGLTEDQEDALTGGGVFGTPSASNKFLTESFYTTSVVDTQEFTETGTWTKPSYGNFAFVQVWGAGGGGGAAKANNDSYAYAPGGGGGAYNQFYIPLALLSATETVTVGTGGAGGSAAVADAGAITGGTGGVSWFKNTTYQANGGVGAVAQDNDNVLTQGGGAGGAVGTSLFVDYEVGGEGGDSASGSTTAGANTSYSGAGGGGARARAVATQSSGFSAGGTTTFYTSSGGTGAAALNADATAGAGVRGGGGGGAAVGGTTGTATSGAGGDGYVRVTVF